MGLSLRKLISGKHNCDADTNSKGESALIEVKGIDKLIFGFPQRIESGDKNIYLTEGIILANYPITKFIGEKEVLDNIKKNVPLSPYVFRNELYFKDKKIKAMYGFTTDQFRKIIDDHEENVFKFLDELDKKYKS